jgi:hypothetical protein
LISGSGASLKVSALSRASLGARLPALQRARHFALAGKTFVITDQGSLLISAGGTRSDPAIYSATTSTMIIPSNSLAGAGRPISLTVIYGTPCTSSELPHVRTELQSLLIVPSLAPHPIQADCQSAGHRHLGDGAPTTHRQVQKPMPPVGIGISPS